MDRSQRRREIIAPRAHSKSTLASLVYPMWTICFNNPNDPKFIVLVSESQDQACNFLANIQMQLEDNPRVASLIAHDLFGVESLVGPKWTQTDFITKNNVRVKAVGSGQKIRGINHMGKRPTDIIVDDFESEHNTFTKEMRDKNMDWMAGAVEPSLDDDGVITLIGTIAHQQTYLTAARDDPSYRTLFFQAIEDGKPLWPERFPQERLDEIRESYRAKGLIHMYYQEYMNQPRNPEEQAFKYEDFKYWEGHLGQRDGFPYISLKQEDGSSIEKPVNVFVGVDLAISSRGDYNVILPLAMDNDENIYIGDYYRARVEPNEIIDKMFEFNAKYAPSVFVIETTAYQQALVLFLRREMARQNIYFPVREVKPRIAKDVRLMGLQPYFVASKVYHKKRHTELEAELLAFPKGKNDDCLDAFWEALHCATRVTRDWTTPVDDSAYHAVESWRIQ